MSLSPSNDDEIVQLRSEDGEVFEIQMFHLKSASSVFRDMFTVTNGQAKTSTTQPIEIPFPSGIVRLFVDLMRHASLPPSHDIRNLFPQGHPLCDWRKGVDVLSTVLGLLDQFDCAPAFGERLFTHFEPHYDYDAWTVYCLAANHNNIYAAKNAIRAMRGYKCAYNNISTTDAARLPLKWLLGYIKADAEMSAERDSDRDQMAYWHSVAARLDISV